MANLAYPGATHAPPVVAGTPSPWITLIALRVLKKYASALVTAIPDLPPFGA